MAYYRLSAVAASEYGSFREAHYGEETVAERFHAAGHDLRGESPGRWQAAAMDAMERIAGGQSALDTSGRLLIRCEWMQSSLRKFSLLLVAAIAFAALLYKFRGAIGIRGFQWSALAAAVRQARLSLFLLSIVAIYGCYAIRALRWERFSRYLGRPTFAHVYAGTLMGFASLFVLGRIGEPIRPLLIARKDALPVSGTFGVYVLERVLDIGATAVSAGLALLLFARMDSATQGAQPLLHAARRSGVVLLAGTVIALLGLVYLRLHGARRILARLEKVRVAGGRGRRLAALFEDFNSGLQAIRSMTDLAWAVGYTLAHWLLVACIYLWVLHAFGGRLGGLGFGDALLVMIFTLVGSAVQLPGVGGGSQVASFLVLTAVFGVEKEAAAAAAIMIWLITFTAVSLAGVPLLVREGLSVGELRNLAREGEADLEAAPGEVPGASRSAENSVRKTGP
jgi:glycosyltransferase 2 family protein